MAYVLAYAPARNRVVIQVAGIVTIVAGLVLAIMIRDQQITQLVIDQLGGLPTR